MTNKERLQAVFSGKTPDRIPFAPFRDVMPDCAFTRELVARGMAFIDHCPSIIEHYDQVEFVEKHKGNRTEILIQTPVGEASTMWEKSSERAISGGDIGAQIEFAIKDEDDYEAVIYMIDHTDYASSDDVYQKAYGFLGENGVMHTWTNEPPFMDAQYFLGLENWSYHQADCPELFEALLESLSRRQERRMRVLAEAPDSLINLGNLAGNFGPSQFEEHMLPYFQKYSSLLKSHGKKTTIHADANNLTIFSDLVKKTGVDVVEAFTPPPFGNLSLKDARAAWGEDVTIWINFPEAVFYEGYKNTKQFTIELLKSDPCPNKFISLTELGLLGVKPDEEPIFHAGITAVMDAIDDAGRY